MSQSGVLVVILLIVGIVYLLMRKQEHPIVEHIKKEKKDNAEYWKYLDEKKKGGGDIYIREIAAAGASKIKEQISGLPVNKNAQEKYDLLLRKLAGLAKVDVSDAQDKLAGSSCKLLLESSSGFECDTFDQVFSYAMYKSYANGSSLGHGIPRNCIALEFLLRSISASGGANTRSYLSNISLIGFDVEYCINEDRAKYYLNAALLAAERSCAQLVQTLDEDSLAKSLQKKYSAEEQPIFHLLSKIEGGGGDDIRKIESELLQNRDRFPDLTSFISRIKSQQVDKVLGFSKAAELGEASSKQYAALVEVSEAIEKKFDYLLMSFLKSIEENSKKLLINEGALKRLDDLAIDIGLNECMRLIKRRTHFEDYDSLRQYLTERMLLKKTLDAHVKNRQISDADRGRIMNSANNFACPMCAETIGDKINVCPYCQHKLS